MKLLIKAYLISGGILVGILIISSIAFAAPTFNILGNYAGVAVNATTTANANFTASGTVAFPNITNSILGTDGNGKLVATTTSSGVGTTTINGVPGPDFTFNASTTGSDFTISTTTGIVYFNFPSASASNRGLLTSANWTTFNNKQDSGLALLIASNLSDLNSTSTARTNIGFTAGTGITISGAGAIANSGVISNNSITGAVGFLAGGTNLSVASSGQNITYTWTDPGYLTTSTDIYWTGTSTNLVAATGRTSLGLGSIATFASTDYKTSSSIVAIAQGGTNATSAAAALSNLGGISTSTGLTTANFATTSISQWNNDSGYVTSTGSGTLTGNSTNTYMAFYTGATTLGGNSALTFNNSTAVLTIPTSTITTSLAIGTSTQLSGVSLRVFSTGNTATDIESSNGGSTSELYFKNSSTSGRNYILGVGGNTNTYSQRFFIIDQTAGVSRFVIDSSGNVGIGVGTSIPSSTLHVIGDLRVSASSTLGGLTNVSTLIASGAINASTTLTVTGTSTFQANVLDAGGNKYVTSTGSGTLTGNGTSTWIPFYDTATAFLSSSNLTWTTSTNALNVGAGGKYQLGGINMIIGSSTLNSYYLGGAGNLTATGGFTVGVGKRALELNTTGQSNVGIGYQALGSNTTGNDNTGLGDEALVSNTTGDENTSIGYSTLFSNATGTGNVALGSQAGYYETLSNAFYVGNVKQTNTANDKAYSLLYGKFAGAAGTITGQQLTINGNVGIGTTSPSSTLHIIGGITQSSGVNSIASTTVNGNATTTSLTVSGVASALGTFSATGVLSAYAGSNCTAGSVSTGLSATGTVPCVTTSSILTGYSTSTGANPTASIGTSAVNGTSNNFMRADGAPALGSQFASSTWSLNIANATTTASTTNYGVFRVNAARTLTAFNCYDTVGTTTLNMFIPTGFATTTVSSTINGSFACGVAGNSSTSNIGLAASSYIIVQVSSTAGTPVTTGVFFDTKKN